MGIRAPCWFLIPFLPPAGPGRLLYELARPNSIMARRGDRNDRLRVVAVAERNVAGRVGEHP